MEMLCSVTDGTCMLQFLTLLSPNKQDAFFEKLSRGLLARLILGVGHYRLFDEILALVSRANVWPTRRACRRTVDCSLNIVHCVTMCGKNFLWVEIHGNGTAWNTQVWKPCRHFA